MLALDLFSEFADHIAVRKILLGVQDRVEGRVEPMAQGTTEFFIYLAAALIFLGAIVLLLLRARFQAAGREDRLMPHSTRHSFITLTIRHGASIAQAQAAARHTDPRTTMRYAHDMDTLEDHAADYVTRLP